MTDPLEAILLDGIAFCLNGFAVGLSIMIDNPTAKGRH